MGRQSSRLYYQGKDHKDIYFQGHYHDAMYVGSQLVWEKLQDKREITPLTEKFFIPHTSRDDDVWFEEAFASNKEGEIFVITKEIEIENSSGSIMVWNKAVYGVQSERKEDGSFQARGFPSVAPTGETSKDTEHYVSTARLNGNNGGAVSMLTSLRHGGRDASTVLFAVGNSDEFTRFLLNVSEENTLYRGVENPYFIDNFFFFAEKEVYGTIYNGGLTRCERNHINEDELYYSSIPHTIDGTVFNIHQAYDIFLDVQRFNGIVYANFDGFGWCYSADGHTWRTGSPITSRGYVINNILFCDNGDGFDSAMRKVEFTRVPAFYWKGYYYAKNLQNGRLLRSTDLINWNEDRYIGNVPYHPNGYLSGYLILTGNENGTGGVWKCPINL